MAVKGRDIALRAASAVVLAPAAVAATWGGGVWFLALMIVASVVLAFEWAAMSAPHARRVMGGAVSFGVVAAVISAHFGAMSVAFIMLVFGAVAAGVYARSRGQEALDAAYGVLYLGWPSVLLIWLRDVDSLIGLHWTVLVFAVAWSADIVAYLAGSTFGGPKLWPRFSPNKTWSGFIGGVAAGAVAGAVMTAWVNMGALSVVWGRCWALPRPWRPWRAICGIGAEATVRGQGCGQHHSRPRRPAGSCRWFDVRGRRRRGGPTDRPDAGAWGVIRRRITVLGATGSVGASTLDLMAQAEATGTGAFEVEALTGGATSPNWPSRPKRWRPKLAVTADPARLDELRDALSGTDVAVAAGDAAVVEAATRPADWIMASIVGAAGLKSAWAAAGTGATLALANKESLVCCGPALIERVKRAGGA